MILEKPNSLDTPLKFTRNIHILYVPTIFCNLGCSYCYLGNLTEKKLSKVEENKILDTLSFALNKFINNGVLPFNVSLHGGEVTTLPDTILTKLFSIINKHYTNYFDALQSKGFKKYNPHIKTNLYNFDKLVDLFISKNVSISASVDLPLSLHETYRTTKNGKSTLDKIIANIRLLAKYPHPKKISCTIFEEHLNKTDEIIKDINFIHNELGFDMNQFNIMFGFNLRYNASKNELNGIQNLQQASEIDQVLFYQRLKKEFIDTDLEYGFKKNWFDEFTSSYCTSAVNCGEKFFLLQSDGNLFSCVRGQNVDAFSYGNIYTDDIDSILNNSANKISKIHQQNNLHIDCQNCEYLKYCNTGCAYVKNEMNTSKSYTCAIQKEIYKDNPFTYPIPTIEEQKKYLKKYIYKVSDFKLTKEILMRENNLIQLIDEDPVLKKLYDKNGFVLEWNDQIINLHSQILKTQRTILTISQKDVLKIHIRKDIFLC